MKSLRSADTVRNIHVRRLWIIRPTGLATRDALTSRKWFARHGRKVTP